MEWSPVYHGLYWVSDAGEVYSVRRQRLLSTSIDSNGYVAVNMHSPGDRQRWSAHRLVATEFIPNPLNLPAVNHLNGDKTDNRASNLEWCTLADNNKHARDTGLWAHRGEQHTNAVLSDEDVRQLKAQVLAGDSQRTVAARLGVSQQLVSLIVRGLRRKDVA